MASGSMRPTDHVRKFRIYGAGEPIEGQITGYTKGFEERPYLYDVRVVRLSENGGPDQEICGRVCDCIDAITAKSRKLCDRPCNNYARLRMGGPDPREVEKALKDWCTGMGLSVFKYTDDGNGRGLR